MKTTIMMVTIAAGLVMQGVALGADTSSKDSSSSPSSNPSATANAQRGSALQIFKLFEPNKTPMSSKIYRVDGISSRPWAQTVGWSGGSQTQFMGDRERLYEPNFSLFWMGRRPQ